MYLRNSPLHALGSGRARTSSTPHGHEAHSPLPLPLFRELRHPGFPGALCEGCVVVPEVVLGRFHGIAVPEERLVHESLDA